MQQQKITTELVESFLPKMEVPGSNPVLASVAGDFFANHGVPVRRGGRCAWVEGVRRAVGAGRSGAPMPSPVAEGGRRLPHHGPNKWHTDHLACPFDQYLRPLHKEMLLW